MIIAITMWATAIILEIAAYKTKSQRWVMSLAFFAGLAGFSMVWLDNEALVVKWGLSIRNYKIIKAVFSGLSHYFIPYCALMFGVSCIETLNAKLEKTISILLLIPLAITLLIYPTHDCYFQTSYQVISYYHFVSIWAVPYLLVSCILQIYAYLKEDISYKKRQRYIFCIITIPGLVFISVTTYLLSGYPIGEPWKYWRYNVIIIIYMFAVFLYSLIKYGVLGIKIYIEKQNLSHMMNALDSGMKILSHTLKNEITKISICMTNIKLSMGRPGNNESDMYENIQMVSTSLEYLSNMMKKLQRNSIDPGKFDITRNNLSEIIEHALENVAVFLKTKKIHVDNKANPGISILCDKVYLQEVFVSIYQNAIEAMETEGKLGIGTILTSKYLVVVIKDNGLGILEKDLPHVVEPFFTTKNKSNNFGLGLSYCYNILKKHGASIEVQSERNAGTTVSLFFPKSKVSETA